MSRDISMRNWEVGLLAGLAVLAPLPAAAQEHQHESPYAGLETREIKALSAEDVEGLLEGEGMSFALAAELNGLPGPRHVLDMADMLALTAEQEERVLALFDEMSAEARATGARVVDLERELDREFADGTISEERLERLVEQLALEQGRLRAVHLRAHLRLVPILSDEQRERYNRMRGYSGEG